MREYSKQALLVSIARFNTLECVTRPEKLLGCIQQISCRGYSNPVKTVLLLWFIGLKPSVVTLSEIVMEAKNRVILSLTLLYHSLVCAGEYKIFIPWLLHLLSQTILPLFISVFRLC